MIIQVCVGSSCHMKGSKRIVELMQQALAASDLQHEVELAGSFCTGQCNRVGVTITVDDATYTDVTPENFTAFFDDKILHAMERK